jgi:hypothetical protein
MSEEFIEIIKLNSNEQFKVETDARAIVLIVEDFSPGESFCDWLENLEIPVILALKTRTNKNLVSASHLCVAAGGSKIEDNTAEDFLQRGLINKIVLAEDVENTALGLAEKISSLAPLAIRACLKAVNRGLKLPLEDGLKIETELFTQIFSTADMREGTRAFLEKRKPVFKGK